MMHSLYTIALLILMVTSIPTLLQRGAGLPGVIICMVIVGLALGGVRSALPPFLGMIMIRRAPEILEAHTNSGTMQELRA